MNAAGPFSVIIPVHDEATLLPETVPVLLKGLDPRAEVVFVCNGCSDDSAEILRRLCGGAARVIELAAAGKPGAIRAGEAEVTAFPRVYLDSDVWIDGAAINALVATQEAGDWELVSPRLSADTRGQASLARWVTEVWMASPHIRSAGFHCVLCVSAAGRARWQALPDIINDDDFMTARIPLDRRHVAAEIRALIRPPRRFGAWVRVRERWVRGAMELSQGEGGPERVAGAGGRGLLAAMLARPAPAATYASAVLLGRLRARFGDAGRATRWYHDKTSRIG